jgi:hypothetical protein
MYLFLAWQSPLNLRLSSAKHERSKDLMQLADHLSISLFNLSLRLFLGICEPVVEELRRIENLWDEEVHQTPQLM